jgi:tetratricopeptide (TPR) repeat protein
LIWGSYAYTGEEWKINLFILNLSNTNGANHFVIDSSNWTELQNAIINNTLIGLRIEPPKDTQLQSEYGWTASAAAVEDYGTAEIFRLEQKPLTEQEKWIRLAIKADPNFANAYARLANLLCAENKIDDAKEMILKSIKMDSQGAFNHKEYASILYANKEYDEAEAELKKAARLDPFDGETHDHLGDLYLIRGLYPQAIENYKKALQLDPYAPFASNARAELEYLEPRQTAFFFANAAPIEYSELFLSNRLLHAFSANKLEPIKNPLSSNAEMQRWVTTIIVGATNDFQKAKLIFDAFTQRVNGGALFQQTYGATAQEMFANWKNSNNSFSCQQATILYIALARAAGLEAYSVQVEEACDGSKALHACAAIYIGGKLLLVDPSYFWFGAPHKKFTVLSDLQTMAVFLSTFPGLEYRRVAAELAPDIAIVQYNLCFKLMQAGQWAEAEEILPLVTRLDPYSALSNSLRGWIAFHGGRLDEAANCLQKAIEIDPNEAIFFMQLGDIYAAQGRFDNSRASFQRVLNCDHTSDDAINVNESLSKIDQMALTYYGQGIKDETDGNWSAAFTNFNKAIQVNPCLADAYGLRGYIEQVDSNYDAALSDYNEVIKLKPESAIVYLDRGQVRQIQGNLEYAESDYEEAANLNASLTTNVAYEFRDLGYSRYERQEFTNALSDFRKAFKFNPMDDYAHFDIWLVRSRLGETKAATEELENYLATRNAKHSGDWPFPIGRFLVGQISEHDLVKAVEGEDFNKDEKKRCEAYFYAASKRLIAGDEVTAIDYFNKCILSNFQNSVEFQHAKSELRRLSNQPISESHQSKQ